MRHGYAAIVLTGGRAKRLGGASKATLDVGGRSLIDRVLASVPDAQLHVVVGEDTHPGAVTVTEKPPGSGPAYAVMAGVEVIPQHVPLVAILAVDLPFVTNETITELIDAIGGADGALLHDPAGNPQWLCGVWKTESLRRAGAGIREGASMRSLLSGLNAATVTTTDQAAPPWFDCDTPEALNTARRIAASRRHETPAVHVEGDAGDVSSVD